MYAGGDGSSFETAVVVEADDTLAGVQAEYAYVAARHGRREVDWRVTSQALIGQKDRHYDVLDVELKSGESKSYYFDITQFFGKLQEDSPQLLKAVCPHCRERQELIRTALRGKGEVLVCLSCMKLSREGGIAGRMLYFVLLVPVALLLATGVGTGVYFLAGMVGEEFSPVFAGIGLFLLLVAGYAEYRTIMAMWRFLRIRELLPTDGFLTDL